MSRMLLTGAGTNGGVPANAILDEDGMAILDESGDFILDES